MSLSQNAKHTIGPPRPNDAMSIYHMGPKQIIIIFLSLTTALSNFPHEVEWEIENPIEKKIDLKSWSHIPELVYVMFML